MRKVRGCARWLLAPDHLRAKAAVLAGALPLGVAVALVAAQAGVVTPLVLALGGAATLAVVAVASWLLEPASVPAAFARLERLREAQRELALEVRSTAPRRANILVPIVDPPHFFGGHIGVFNLARRLAEHGLRVRLVAIEPQPALSARWGEELGRFEGVARALELIEVEFAGDRGGKLEVSPDDTFLAVSSWTAHVAHRATASLGRSPFVHLVQDYDALAFPTGSLAAVARAAYELPHRAVFSTEPLREYFRTQRLGVFAAGAETGERDSAVFRSAITPVGPVTADELARRPRRACSSTRGPTTTPPGTCSSWRSQRCRTRSTAGGSTAAGGSPASARSGRCRRSTCPGGGGSSCCGGWGSASMPRCWASSPSVCR